MIYLDVAKTINSIHRAQAKNLRCIAELKPSGRFGRVIRDIAIRLHRRAVAVTPEESGALAAAHRIDYQEDQGRALARIFIASDAVNPKGFRPAYYGPIQHTRGGAHAFYDRALQDEGGDAAIVGQVEKEIQRILID